MGHPRTAPELISQLFGLRPARAQSRLSHEPENMRRAVAEGFADHAAGLLGVDRHAVARAYRHCLWVAELASPAKAERFLAITLWAKGKYRQSAEAFERSGSRGDSALSIGAIDAYARAGLTSRAIELGIRLLDDPGLDTFQTGRIHLNLGNAYAWADRLDEAARAYQLAQARLGRVPALQAAALLGASTACTFGGKPKQGRRLALRAGAKLERLGLTAYNHQIESNLAYADLLEGKPDLAYLRLIELEEADLNPVDLARRSLFLGEAALSMNLAANAATHLRGALEKERLLPLLNRADARLALAQCLGSTPEAQILRRDARRLYRQAGNQVWSSIAALQAIVRGELKQSPDAHLQTLRSQGEHWQLAAALLAVAEWELSVGKPLESHLDEAETLIRKQRLPLAWKLHFLRAQADPRRAKLHYGRMLKAMVQLRGLSSLTSARRAFFTDKTAALRAALQWFASRGNIEETRQVLQTTQAITLFEELVSENPDAIPEFRGFEETASSPSPGTRRSTPSKASRVDLSRLASKPVPKGDWVASLAIGSGSVWRIAEDLSQVDLSDPELADLLRWAEFELLTRMGGGEALAKIGGMLEPLVREDHLCLSGRLWSVPWSLVVPDRALSFHLHPMRLPDPVPPATERVAIWVGEHHDLPHIEEELAVIRAIFPHAQTFSGADEVRNSLSSQWDLLHVATHGVANPLDGMLSALRFPDGDLYAAEIARAGRIADHVVLATCDSGAFDLTHATEPQGLVRAFLAAGAREVVASQWPIDDRAAPLLAETLYQRAPNQGFRIALHHARQKLRDNEDSPYFWAGLMHFRGYR